MLYRYIYFLVKAATKEHLICVLNVFLYFSHFQKYREYYIERGGVVCAVENQFHVRNGLI